ncbi:hypothetical protein XENTR_v10008502 [Xenopus tropicalis]|nr:hypothetical protein XENTR_v10008502 [Xenopus tropicalis]
MMFLLDVLSLYRNGNYCTECLGPGVLGTKSRLDSFRLLKYDINSCTELTESKVPLLLQRHSVAPGMFLMYIRGKLLFANYIFNGYSRSVKDLQKQIVKTRSDYQMGYSLPSDFKFRTE